MSFVPLIAAIVFGILMSVLVGASPLGIFWFMIVAGLGGLLASLEKKGSERAYWAVVVLIVVMTGLAIAGVAVPSALMIAPLVFGLGYFVARLVGRLTGQRSNLPDA